MASSDEEGEIFPDWLTDYYFVGTDQNPISFSCLPLKWDDDDEVEEHESTEHAFLRGTVEDGHREIYRKAIAWKFVLCDVLPEIYVLMDAKNGRWIKLQNPQKSYEETIRTVLISVHCLHFMKKNPDEECGEALWKHIRKTFSTYVVPPSVKDLEDHLQWIKEAAIRDKDISKAKNLASFLSEISGKRKAVDEENGMGKRPMFIVSDDDKEIENLDDSCDEEIGGLFDHVCALCDDGGDLLCCEGRCIRSFHPTIESGTPSSCESLGYNSEHVQAIPTFMCNNCQYKRHQCYICGRLGSSDKSSGAEVFPCVSATCGHFYHPKCVSELIFPGDENRAKILQKQIQAGDTFMCPAHVCCVCGQGENKNVTELQFAVCRRCPKAYHRKCLPRKIHFQSDDANNIPQRAWEGLLFNRILIYCLDHKICRKTFTPKRDHLLFPEYADGDKESNMMSERRSKVYGILTDEVKVEEKSRTGDFINRNEKNLSRKFTKLNERSSLLLRLKTGKPMSTSSMGGVRETAGTLKTPEMRSRIQELIKNSESSFNAEEFLAEQRRSCGNALTSLSGVDKTMTLGKVECLVQAMQAALKKIEDGGTIEDAKAVCEPAVLSQLFKLKNKLGVYLAPFIHGMRYTSFGRHFTKVEKLKQVVSRLCWYARDGDTIVDFCCGSNDFSCLMKEELDRMGRKCSFKNYDLIQPKNDFNFERRDWMTVGLEELPEGSNLIMGLNPPFGVQASLANKFINKALKFNPKLLILIVPKETKRLDKKKIPYDLIWEDDHILSGKSFYLPGSVDVHDQQMDQWNLDPPPLYLWSRSDWTYTHRNVAQEHGHLLKDQETEHRFSGGIDPNALVSNYLMEENRECWGDLSSVGDGYGETSHFLADISGVEASDAV
ncbi:hypothetical protein CASFOL_011237 [Castilleja foliolosa]|uniref:Zinc finger PHD-type domain-containing protein n=1 Tax=Castilleja foliolosa TaxID=1961234 RepID=A0ABD3DWR4_9LAMI